MSFKKENIIKLDQILNKKTKKVSQNRFKWNEYIIKLKHSTFSKIIQY